ncbi:helix-turn-helix transcriptional regulator [bacterium]|nr:helix-turn-helix transcriptional regulator [bacterium]
MNKVNHTNIAEKLGHKIRIERIKRKMSQEKLAELAQLNRNFIGMVERGETNITIKNLESISQAFEIEIQDLFDFVI